MAVMHVILWWKAETLFQNSARVPDRQLRCMIPSPCRPTPPYVSSCQMKTRCCWARKPGNQMCVNPVTAWLPLLRLRGTLRHPVWGSLVQATSPVTEAWDIPSLQVYHSSKQLPTSICLRKEEHFSRQLFFSPRTEKTSLSLEKVT